MLWLILVVFLAAALLGLSVATRHFRGEPTAMMRVAAHGLTATAGLALLTFGIVTGGVPPYGRLALIIFLLAAIGGLTLLAHTARDKRLPGPLIFAHAGVAIVGIAVVVAALFGAGP